MYGVHAENIQKKRGRKCVRIKIIPRKGNSFSTNKRKRKRKKEKNLYDAIILVIRNLFGTSYGMMAMMMRMMNKKSERNANQVYVTTE